MPFDLTRTVRVRMVAAMSAHEIAVRLGSHSYQVRIARHALSWTGIQLGELDPKPGPKVALIADEAVAGLHGKTVVDSIAASGRQVFLLTVPPGETSKSLQQLTHLLSALAQHGLGRKDTVVALGGGVVGDLAGFVAASYLRGVSFVQIPTTLLAMVDSSVGGKTGVNLPEGKNLAGAFHQPRLVIADLDVLDTLPPRELAAGMAEVIKYGIIADKALFHSLRPGQPVELAKTIQRCVEIKAEVVAADEFETNGRRATLNFGHTLGHAIENAGGYGTLLHGEAISIGMRAAAHLSHKKVGLGTGAVQEIERTLAAHHLPLHAINLDREKIRQALKLDKKAETGVNRWILTPKIGQTVPVDDVTAGEVEELIDLVSTPPSA